MGKKASFLGKVSKLFDVPADVLAGQFRLELIGTEELSLEGHRGILSYGPEQIHISLGNMVLKVAGVELELRAMTSNALCITGKIFGVELL